MSTSDYLSVLVTIVVGLGLSRLLTIAGELVLQRHKVRFYCSTSWWRPAPSRSS